MGVGILIFATLFLGQPSPQQGTDAGEDPEFHAATQWLRTLADRNETALRAGTAFPLVRHTTNKRMSCEGRIPESGLTRWMQCFAKNESLLLNDLRENLELHRIEPPGFPDPQLVKLRKRIKKTGTWISTYINGDGFSAEFHFLLVQVSGTPRVGAVLSDIDFHE